MSIEIGYVRINDLGVMPYNNNNKTKLVNFSDYRYRIQETNNQENTCDYVSRIMEEYPKGKNPVSVEPH